VRSSSLSEAAIVGFRVRGQMNGQNLDGDSAVEASIPGAINLAHTASSQRSNDFICTEIRTGGERHA